MSAKHAARSYVAKLLQHAVYSSIPGSSRTPLSVAQERRRTGASPNTLRACECDAAAPSHISSCHMYPSTTPPTLETVGSAVVGRRSECSSPSTTVNSVRAPAWCAAPSDTGTYVSSVVMPRVTCDSESKVQG